MSTDEFEALKRDVATNGILVPVELDEVGAVLDGHHRLRAWTELRSEGAKVPDYPRVIRRFAQEEEKIGHVLSLNLARRHLSKDQRRELVLSLRARNWSLRRIATLLQMNEITVRRDLADATYVAPEALSDADGLDPKATTATRLPSIVVGSARDEARAVSALSELGEDAPRKLLGLPRAETRARAASLAHRRAGEVPPRTEGQLWRVEHLDFRDLDIPDHSVDAMICDPPYTDECIPLWSDLSEFAARVLKPGRLLAAYTGHVRKPEMMDRLSEHLEYVWTGATIFRGRHTKVNLRKINGSHRPWLLYSNGPYEPRGWIRDTLMAPVGTGEKSLRDHPWQQAEEPFRELVQMLTLPGELVVDPFLGSGTTAAAATAEGRRFIGCDVDTAAVAMTLERLNLQIEGEAS